MYKIENVRGHFKRKRMCSLRARGALKKKKVCLNNEGFQEKVPSWANGWPVRELEKLGW